MFMKQTQIKRKNLIYKPLYDINPLSFIFVVLIYPKFISKPAVEVPDVSGMKVAKAENKLEKIGFEVNKVKKEYSDEIKKGRVIETDPAAGRSVKKGSKINLVVSKGSEKIEIEDYTGKNYYEVKAKLEALGLKVDTETKDVADDGKNKKDVILSQDVKPGSKLDKGDVVTLTIPNIYITYPDFANEGYSVVDVKNFAKENDITLEIKYQSDYNKSDGTIVYQNMVAGTKVNKGSTLQITVVKNEEVSDSEPDDKE